MSKNISDVFHSETRETSLWPLILCAAILSLFGTLGRKIVFSGIAAASYTENLFLPFKITDIVWFLCLFGVVFAALLLIDHYRAGIRKILINENRTIKHPVIWFISFFVFFLLAWMPFTLSCFPGGVSLDSCTSIDQALYGVYSNHFPVVYSLYIRIFFRLNEILGGNATANRAVLLYTVVQEMLFSATLSYTCVFLLRKKLRLFYITLTAAYFAFAVIFGGNAVSMLKDPLFSIGLVWLSFFLYEYSQRDGDVSAFWKVMFFVSGFLVLYFRNNGLPVYISALAVFMITQRKHRSYMFFSAAFIAMTAIYLIIHGPVFNALGISKVGIEGLGIPLQQFAYTAVYNADKLTVQQYDVLNNILPFELYGEIYTPCLVDSIKWHDDFNYAYFGSNLVTIAVTWLKMMFGNFQAYVKAYCLETFGFWKPFVCNSYGYLNIDVVGNQFGITNIDYLSKWCGYSFKQTVNGLKCLPGAGTLAWIMLVSLALTVRRGKKADFFVPSFFCWLFILALTPVAFSLRYVLVLPMVLPVIIVFPFIEPDKNGL